MDKKEAIAVLRKYIKFLVDNNYKIKSVYLFGSYAEGVNNEDSDIDVAVFIDGLKDSYATMLQLMKYRRQFDIRIEPHVLDQKDIKDKNPFVNEILRTGVKIWVA